MRWSLFKSFIIKRGMDIFFTRNVMFMDVDYLPSNSNEYIWISWLEHLLNKRIRKSQAATKVHVGHELRVSIYI